jgi:hypothetical protein
MAQMYHIASIDCMSQITTLITFGRPPCAFGRIRTMGSLYVNRA